MGVQPSDSDLGDDKPSLSDLPHAVNFQEYDRVKELFKEAEQIIKYVEQDLNGGVSAPAVLQLRYTGFHLLQSLTDDEAERKKQISKAESHAKRSAHDACEAAVDVMLKRLSAFEHDYRMVSISAIIPEWVNMKSEIVVIRKSLLEAYPRNHASGRNAIRAQLDRLREIERIAQSSRDELNKKMKRDATARAVTYAILFFTVLMVMIMIVPYCWTWLLNFMASA